MSLDYRSYSNLPNGSLKACSVYLGLKEVPI